MSVAYRVVLRGPGQSVQLAQAARRVVISIGAQRRWLERRAGRPVPAALTPTGRRRASRCFGLTWKSVESCFVNPDIIEIQTWAGNSQYARLVRHAGDLLFK